MRTYNDNLCTLTFCTSCSAAVYVCKAVFILNIDVFFFFFFFLQLYSFVWSIRSSSSLKWKNEERMREWKNKWIKGELLQIVAYVLDTRSFCLDPRRVLFSSACDMNPTKPFFSVVSIQDFSCFVRAWTDSAQYVCICLHMLRADSAMVI